MKLIPRKTVPRKTIAADDNIGKGMDLALVTLLFLGLGWAIDGWLDTQPIFTVVMPLVALVGKFIAMWYQYQARMEVLEAERLAARQAHQIPAAPTPSEKTST